MELSVTSRQEGTRTVIAVAGEIDVYTAPNLRERLNELVAAGHYDLIVDMEKVEFLDSTGLGVLVGSRAARLTGICLAAFCLVGQMIFLPVYPFWSLFTMLVSVLVIYGLLAEPRHVHGARL